MEHKITMSDGTTLRQYNYMHDVILHTSAWTSLGTVIGIAYVKVEES